MSSIIKAPFLGLFVLVSLLLQLCHVIFPSILDWLPTKATAKNSSIYSQPAGIWRQFAAEKGIAMSSVHNSLETVNAAATAIVTAESRVQQPTVQVYIELLLYDFVCL